MASETVAEQSADPDEQLGVIAETGPRIIPRRKGVRSTVEELGVVKRGLQRMERGRMSGVTGRLWPWSGRNWASSESNRV